VSLDTATRPRLLIVAGPNGAGKTTITDQGLAHRWFEGCEYINPDLIAQRELGDWNDPAMVLRAAQLATERRDACLREGRSLAFETVFSAPDKVDFVRRGIAAGLQGGHEVPLRKILDRWARSITSCAMVARLVDRLYVYDNSVEDHDAQLVLRATKGTIARQYHAARPWMAPILDELSLGPAID
jgi:predicted ABC-type ATPase